MNHPLPLLLRQGVGHLAFEVKVLLAAHLQRAAELVRRAGQCGIGVATAHKHRRQHEMLLLQRLAHAHHGGQGVDLQLHQACCTAGLHHAVGHHQPHHLAHVLHPALCEYRLVAGKGGQHRVAGNVGRQHQAAHASQRQRRRARHTAQCAVRHRRQDGRRIQRAAQLCDVVNIGGGARHLGGRALMRRGCSTRAPVRLGAHASNSSSPALSRLMARAPWLSSQKRCSRLPSTCTR